MDYRKTALIARLILSALFLLVFAPCQLWANDLPDDATLTGEITQIGQLDRYTFTAETGDFVFITAAELVATNLSPRIELLAPNGTVLDTKDGSAVAAISLFQIPAGGLHTITMRDSNFINTGAYSLYFSRVPGANELGQLPDSISAELRLELGDFDTATFTATVGERVHLNLVNINDSDLSLGLYLFRPNGELAETRLNSLAGGLSDYEIDMTGVWTLVFFDRFDNGPDDYRLNFAKVPQANDKGLLLNNSVHSESLVAGEYDTWVIDAIAGDVIYLSMVDIDQTDAQPRLFLYDRSGNLLSSDGDLTTAFVSGFSVEETGQITVLVQLRNSDDRERYKLHFAKQPGPAEVVLLPNQTTLQGYLSLGDIDTFTFGASAGASIDINVVDTDDGGLSPRFTVYDSDANRITSGSGRLTAQRDFTAPTTGIYSVVLTDTSHDEAGNYTLNYSYIGASPPLPSYEVVLEPGVWHLMGIPGNTGSTLGEVFAGTFRLSAYDDNTATDGWVMFGFEPTQTDPATGVTGSYRKLSLSEPVPQGTGFWLIHLGGTAARLSLPSGTVNATGSTGGGCADDVACISTALDTPSNGGWTIAAVPSVRIPSVDEFRFLTGSPSPLCVDGCTLDTAANVGYAAPNGFFVYEPASNQYRLRAGEDTIAPWTGMWFRANSPSVPGAPQLLTPVR